MNKETIIGMASVIAAVAVVGNIVGVNGLVFLMITILFGLLALFLFTRKSKVAKAGAIVLFPEILTKFLMPRNIKQEINKLSEKETKT
jgi:hypothetical protein